MHVTVEDIIAEGDKVVARITMSGTHQGELMGVAPTGKQITLGLIDIVRFDGGKLVERWVVRLSICRASVGMVISEQ